MTEKIKRLIEILEDEYDTELEYCEAHAVARTVGAKLGSGCTRFGFVFAEEGVCLKIPRYEKTDHNYCENELLNYQASLKSGVDKILLPIEKVIVTSSGLSVYLQPKYDFETADMYYGADDEYDGLKAELKEVYRKHEKLIDRIAGQCYDNWSINSLWLSAVYKEYGVRFLRKFVKWTNENKVNDLHNGNTGFLNGKPIILDYAGYFGD